MSEVYHFDLLTIARTIKKYRKFILTVTLIAGVCGLLLALVKPPKYKASTEFFLQNPFYADRNFIFNYETKFIDYFATDDEVNRLVTLSQSDNVLKMLIDSFDLATVYKFDTTDQKEKQGLAELIVSRVKILRSDKRTVVLSYIDKDAERAANIANGYAFFLERELRNVYNGMRTNMYLSVMDKAAEEDSLIQVLTDSLVKMRNHYGIYDLINPSRYSFVLSSIKSNGNPDFADGIERIQNVAALKDELVKNMAGHITLKNQYTTGTGINQMPLTQSVTVAKTPIEPKGPGLLLITLTCTFLGLFFSIAYVLLLDFYSYLKQKLS